MLSWSCCAQAVSIPDFQYQNDLIVVGRDRLQLGESLRRQALPRKIRLEAAQNGPRRYELDTRGRLAYDCVHK